MMMTVHIDEGLLGHPEEPSRFPRSHATLREPRSAGMAQGMGDECSVIGASRPIAATRRRARKRWPYSSLRGNRCSAVSAYRARSVVLYLCFSRPYVPPLLWPKLKIFNIDWGGSFCPPPPYRLVPVATP